MNHLDWKSMMMVVVLAVFGLSLVIVLPLNVARAQGVGGNQSDEGGVTFRPEGQLVFMSGGKQLKMITIQIADNDKERAQGLMWRYSMPEDDGMLFIFGKEQVLDFWMKNTYIPLDMVFANASGKIVDVFQNATPLSEADISSNKPALYCVEVNGGFCSKYGIKTGDKIEYMR